jgi:ABC-type transport system involved in cytochrome bd biosynthesis fused ATPase/permease subunit
MSNTSLTDATYELVERLEQRRKWFKLIITGSLLVAVSGLSIDAILFMVYSHQKGILLYENMMLILIIIIICSISATIAITVFNKMRRTGNKLKQIDLLEETIYEEVLVPEKDQFR